MYRKISIRKGNESVTVSILYVIGLLIGFVLLVTIFSFWRDDLSLVTNVAEKASALYSSARSKM